MKALLHRWIVLAAVLAATTCPAPVFMKLGDIKGEAVAPGHNDWINILTVSNSFLPGAGPGGAAAVSSLLLTKHADKASPKLFQYCATGQVLPDARLEWTEDTPSHVRYFDVRLQNLVVTAFASAGPTNGPAPQPTETLSLNFEKITWTYTTRHPRARLPRELLSTAVKITDGTVSGTTNTASFTVAGIRHAGGQVELQWQGKAGQTYDVYAVSSLTGPFSPRGQVTATADGPMTHTEAALPGAAFFVVEERP